MPKFPQRILFRQFPSLIKVWNNFRIGHLLEFRLEFTSVIFEGVYQIKLTDRVLTFSLSILSYLLHQSSTSEENRYHSRYFDKGVTCISHWKSWKPNGEEWDKPEINKNRKLLIWLFLKEQGKEIVLPGPRSWVHLVGARITARNLSGNGKHEGRRSLAGALVTDTKL